MTNEIVKRIVWALSFALLSSSLQAAEAEGEQLAKAEKCYACHAIEEPLIGPPYKAIAARHAADKQLMEQVLAHKIIHGGGGNWGVVPMVPNEHVSDENARALARWILSL